MGDFTYASKCTLLPRGRRHRGIVGGHLFVEGIAVHGVELVLEGIMKIRSFGSDLPKEDRYLFQTLNSTTGHSYQPTGGQGVQVNAEEANCELAGRFAQALGVIVPPPRPAGRHCAACCAVKPGLLRCARCKEVLDCDAECQLDGWVAHKPHCKPRARAG